jgi:transcriptional regulator with XRE-family HTH domain
VARPAAPTSEELGLAVRELRTRSGMSQEELAHASSLHPTYLSGIERGQRNPTWKILGRLSDALGVKVSDLTALAERIDGDAPGVESD